MGILSVLGGMLVRREFLKMYAMKTKSRNLYLEKVPTPHFDSKSGIRIAISRKLYSDVSTSVDHISQGILSIVLDGITKEVENNE